MANLFTSMINKIGQSMGGWLSPYISGGATETNLPVEDLKRRYALLRNYYNGDHRPQLRVKDDGQDENITQNFIGLAVDRSVSRVLRGGVRFVLPEGADKQQEYLDKVWAANKKEIILHQYVLHGSVYGTTYFKTCPDELIDPFTNELLPRLIPIDPEIIRIKTEAHDMNDVKQYLIEYSYIKELPQGNTSVQCREIIRKSEAADYEGQTEAQDTRSDVAETWQMEEWEQVGSGAWELKEVTEWPYNFPPIIHQKNLPSLKNCYGDSDIDDVVNVQDKSNFVTSNTAKIVKFFANPITFVFGISAKGMKENKLDSAVGTLYAIPDKDAKANNLEMASDLSSSRNLSSDLRQSIFDISREVDMSSISDKLGALTNFGLSVLYTDAIDKNTTKRALYGDALLELNRRLLVIAGDEGLASDPGYIVWGNAMVVNIMEELTADQTALGMGIVDKQTVAERYVDRYGVDWDTIQANIANDKAAENALSSDVGSIILRNFNQGL